MVKLGAFKGPFSQPVFKACFIMLVAILEGLFKVDGRSVLQVICYWMHLGLVIVK